MIFALVNQIVTVGLIAAWLEYQQQGSHLKRD
jgi:hypothetical protein